MRNRMYGGVRGRKTKVGEKLLRFSPTRFSPISWVLKNTIFRGNYIQYFCENIYMMFLIWVYVTLNHWKSATKRMFDRVMKHIDILG